MAAVDFRAATDFRAGGTRTRATPTAEVLMEAVATRGEAMVVAAITADAVTAVVPTAAEATMVAVDTMAAVDITAVDGAGACTLAWARPTITALPITMALLLTITAMRLAIRPATMTPPGIGMLTPGVIN